MCLRSTTRILNPSYLLFLVCLRIQINPQNKGEFLSISPERAFADFLFAHTVLHLVVMNFIGWNRRASDSQCPAPSEGEYFTHALLLKMTFMLRIALCQGTSNHNRDIHTSFLKCIHWCSNTVIDILFSEVSFPSSCKMLRAWHFCTCCLKLLSCWSDFSHIKLQRALSGAH